FPKQQNGLPFLDDAQERMEVSPRAGCKVLRIRPDGRSHHARRALLRRLLSAGPARCYHWWPCCLAEQDAGLRRAEIRSIYDIGASCGAEVARDYWRIQADCAVRVSSTRRFFARPAAVSLDATGSASPKPWADSINGPKSRRTATPGVADIAPRANCMPVGGRSPSEGRT